MFEISRVGIVGAGTMGTLIALRCALFNKTVNLFSSPPETLDAAMNRIRDLLAQRVREGTLDAATAEDVISRVRPTSGLEECVSDVELVIEAVPENLDLKRRLFAEIDRLTTHALIATCSSSLPCSRLAEVTSRPERVLNLHFSHPGDGRPVDVMGGSATSPETLAAGTRFVQSLKMVPLVVKREIMGFGTNTIWHEIKRAALRIAAGGHVDFEDIDRHWLMTFGPLPPFAHMDLVGLDVVRDIEMQYYHESGDARNVPPPFLDVLIAHGRLGVKSGQGFYSYPNPEYKRPGWLRKEPPWTPDMTIRLEGIA